jgi:hypothetical protein
MRMRGAFVLACFGLANCGGCKSCNDGAAQADAATDGPATANSLTVVAEALPRCRADAARAAIPGEDVVVGDVAIGPAGLLVGVVRKDPSGKRVASIARVSLDLANVRVVDVGPAIGDDPAPSPRWKEDRPYVAFATRKSNDAGPSMLREVRVARVEEDAIGKVEHAVTQQADESTAFDLVWPEKPSSDNAAPLMAWDEDAPPSADASVPGLAERGFVKVQLLGEGHRPRVASPEKTDAEAPRLLARKGGFWLAWLARRAEGEEPSYVEGPGEKRAYRWVEVVALDAKGDAEGPIRRVSPEKGRVVAFELARMEGDLPQLVIMVQDEAAYGEGVGGRIVRHALVGDKVESMEVVDAGVGHALAELVPVASLGGDAGTTTRWLTWTDTNDRAHVLPLGKTFAAVGTATSEPSLEGARVLAAAPPDVVYGVVHGQPEAGARPELRRFVCR